MKTEYEKVLLPKSVQQELEKLRTQAVADAAEVARLQEAFSMLIAMGEESLADGWDADLFDKGWNQATKTFIQNIYRITGVEG